MSVTDKIVGGIIAIIGIGVCSIDYFVVEAILMTYAWSNTTFIEARVMTSSILIVLLLIILILVAGYGVSIVLSGIRLAREDY